MLSEQRIATVFGASGFLGRHVVQRLCAQGYLVRVAVRDTEAAMFLRPMGDVGQVVLLSASVQSETDSARAIAGAEVVINLVGILAERRKGDFTRIHAEGAGRVARLAAAAGAAYFVQVSAIGADAASPSLYGSSKALGEAAVLTAFPTATILRPSIMFGADDNFFNRFAAMATTLPVLPIAHGQSKFQPVYVGDVADAVLAVLKPEARGRTYELGGPEVKTFHALLTQMLHIIERKSCIWDMPLALAWPQALLLQNLPGKLLTTDQLRLLERDNVVADGALGLVALGVAPKRLELVLPAYLARYRPCGQGREAVFRE